MRQVRDLPLGSRLALIRLAIRRFVCMTAACEKVTFAGQADGLTARYQRWSVPLADIRALDARLAYVRKQIAALVTASGTTLTAWFGIGPVIAGRMLAETGGITRFASKDAFTSYNGTAPIDVSSGDQNRHRLSRAGNRRINHALHMMAITQLRYPGSARRQYYERTCGRTPGRSLTSGYLSDSRN